MLVELLEELYWFKWEVYVIWIIGVVMFFIVYYFNVLVMMVDKFVVNFIGLEVVGVGIGILVLGWIVYDLFCKLLLGKCEGLLGLVMFVFIVVVVYLFIYLLLGCVVYIYVGVMIGIIMVGNVFMVIILG